ncbi:DUF6519 domain-containing protein [Streptomyces sp. NPDC002055]|uniref:DUF6519 domain-containing protein n=1 Tax=Streptomyces sp. NPDC002055 TaxID=3154534 RepID=UPI0033167CF8
MTISHAHDDPGNSGTRGDRIDGSVVLLSAELGSIRAELTAQKPGEKLHLLVGDGVEMVDSGYTDRGEPAPLLCVEEVDLPGRRVRLSGEPLDGVGLRADHHPFLRRRHQRPPARSGERQPPLGSLRIQEGAWTDPEDGVRVRLAPQGPCRPGDPWLIPARTATGSVEWPVDAARRPLLRDPAGVLLHFAPLTWCGTTVRTT